MTLNEGLAELRKALKIHKRDVIRVHGSAKQWRKDIQKIYAKAQTSVAVASAVASPAISLLLHGKLKPSTMAATIVASSLALPIMGSLKHLKQVHDIYKKNMELKKKGVFTEDEKDLE